MNTQAILQIEELTKFYRGKPDPAIDKISLEVYKSEIFGLLGPNGAGKTTIISIISSLLKATSGKIIIDGMETHVNLNEIKYKIGVVAQDIALYDRLTASENLYYFGRLYGLGKNELTERIEYLLKRLGLEKQKKQKIKAYSGGMKRRVNLIAGLLHNPELLILDEPTAGVDVQSRNVIREFLFELKDKGTTIIYTSHQMEDAEKLCNRICIIDYGKIISSGNPKDLIDMYDDCETLEDVFLKLTGRKLRDS